MEVIHDKELQKFYVIIEGKESHLEYDKMDNVLNLNHTYVPDDLRGRGIASEIVKEALTYATENDLKIIPSCSYVRAYLQRHKEYEHLSI